MISPKQLVGFLKEAQLTFFVGVPDSIMSGLLGQLDELAPVNGLEHTVTANEGGAVALAAGYHLRTGNVPLVYLQNSGLGNALNPLLSLAHRGVFSIPLVLLLGWRGKPGTLDEPQHLIQGVVTKNLLKECGIECREMSTTQDGAKKDIAWAVNQARKTLTPVCLLVAKDSFSPDTELNVPNRSTDDLGELSREQIINIITDEYDADTYYVATTGFISRQLYKRSLESSSLAYKSFYVVGSMGHASMIALGVAMCDQSKRIICLDGDGAALMHLGNMATIGSKNLPNFIHLILNNNCHESVGGLKTTNTNLKFGNLATEFGYERVLPRITTEASLRHALKLTITHPAMTFMEILCGVGYSNNLPRPRTGPVEQKNNFMKSLGGEYT